MKYIVLFALLSAGVVSAQTGDTNAAPPAKKTAVTKKPAPAKKPVEAKKPAPPTIQPLTLPKDAVAKPEGGYAYTDKAGKKWIYHETPFGVSRIPDVGEPAPAVSVATPKEQLVKATDNGETVKFQRQTPFGVTNWEKKKSDLTDEERQILEAQQAKSTPDQPE